MMNKAYSLGIVQSHLTQFDGPLFRRIVARSDLEVTVYLTHSDEHQMFYDPELRHASGWDHDVISGYRYHTFPTQLGGRLRMAYRIASSEHDLVIVAGYSSLILLLVAILSKLRHTPVGLRADSILLYRTKTTWKWRLKDLVLPILYRLYTTMHPVGNLTRSMMIHYRFPEQAIFLFPYAVDNDYLRQQFELTSLQRDSLRQEMGIGPNDQVILGVLKFVPREDPLTLLKAYNQIASSFPRVHLILVGDGHLQSTMDQYIVRRALPRVHLPGYVPYSHLPRYFAMADVFVHPAQVEPWGVTVNEAMVCGLPVIAADTVGAAYDLVTEGKTGLVFQAGNADSLAVQLEQFLRDRNLGNYMARNAAERMKDWSYDLTLDQLREALQFVSARQPGGLGD